ncbi:MAG TPA: AAA family ATPase [Pyrinomonadaceae bacterium]|jgi:hypothetical protein
MGSLAYFYNYNNFYNSNGNDRWDVQDVIRQLKGVRQSSANQWSARCPAHDDQRNSLSVQATYDGKVLFHCHAGCSYEEIVGSLYFLPFTSSVSETTWTNKAGDIVATYDYCDENGKRLYQVVRYEGKGFRQRRPDSGGGWIWNLKDVRRVPYRLPELLEADPAINVHVVEGEKDADRLWDLGLVATTNSGGAGKWSNEDSEHLRGRPVVILPDNDEAGRNHAEQVARSLQGVAASVRIVPLPDLNVKGDVSDWMDAGGTVERLHEIVNRAQSSAPVQRNDGRVLSAADLLAQHFPEPRYAVEGVLPEGVTVFAGRPKLGKSWCALGIAVAVACGGHALGTIPVERGDVLYLALEDGARRLQKRLRKMLAGGSTPSNLDFATEWRRLDAGGLDDLEDWLRSHREARLVVIDTLKRVRPAERRAGRLYDGDYEAVAPIGDLARKYGVAVVVVHHTRKADGEDPLDLVSGTTGLTGAADGVMVLKRSRGQADAELHATGRDFEDKQLALRWDVPTCQWVVVGSVEEFQLSRERREVVDLLKKVGSMLPKEIAEALNKKGGTVRKLLSDMLQDWQVCRDEAGRYSVSQNNGNTGNGSNTLFDGGNGGVTAVTAVTADFEDWGF